MPELLPAQGNLIANPGCYATAALLALGPLKDAIDPSGVVVDGKSGMTGAGKLPRSAMHAGSVLENFSPYKVGVHQHAPEIGAHLGFEVTFVPHLLPIRRGLIATCYVRSTGPDLRALLEEHYARSAVVSVLPEGVVPELARVQHSDAAEIGVFRDSAHRPHDHRLRDRQPGQGSSGTGGAERQPRLRVRRDGRAAADRSTRLAMSVTAARGFVASGVAAGIRPSGKPDVALVRSVVPATGARNVDGEPRAGSACDGVETPPRTGPAAGRS